MRYLMSILMLLSMDAFSSSYKINVTETYKNHSGQEGLESFFIALYLPLSISPEFLYYPSKRGLQLVNQGMLDAEAGRFEMVAKSYSSLIKIDEPIRFFHSGYFCLEKESCRIGKSTVVAAQSGFQSAELFCRTNQLNCHLENSPNLLARMLEKQIAQVFFSLNSEAELVLCSFNADTIYFAPISSFSYPSYHYVHKRHVRLVPKLEASMKHLRKTGVIPPLDAPSTPPQLSCNKKVIRI